MDEAGLRRMAIPARISVGAADTQTPPGPNAAFAAQHIPGARLVILPGKVDHEIFDILPRVALARSRPPAPLICVNAGRDDSRYKAWHVQLATNP